MGLTNRIDEEWPARERASMAKPGFAAHNPPSLKLGRSVGDDIDGIAVHPDGSVVTVLYDKGLFMVALPTMKKSAAPETAESLAYAPDGSILVTAKETKIVYRDPSTGAIQRRLPERKDDANSLAFSPDGRQLAVGGYEAVEILDVASGKLVKRIPVFDRIVPRIAWSFDGALIAARVWEEAGVFDVKTGKMVGKLSPLLDEMGSISFLPDGGVIAAIDSKTLGIWAPGSWEAPAKRISTKSFVKAVATCPTVVAYVDAVSIQLLDTSLSPLPALSKLANAPAALALSPDGSILAAGSPPLLLAWRQGASVATGASKTSAAGKATAKAPEVETLITPARTADLDLPPTKVKWLSQLGKPVSDATQAKQLASLDKWPGPDHEGVGALIELLETLDTELQGAAKQAKVKLDTKVYDAVFDLAAKKVGLDEDADEDWSEPTSAAPYMTASIAQLVANYHMLKFAVPSDLATLWAWCVDGHWPSGFVRKPGKKPVQLLVL